eukprot:5790564-Alexandrium_andersonii.AAC.1
MQHESHERSLKSRKSSGSIHPTSSQGQPLGGTQEEFLHNGQGCGASSGSVVASPAALPPAIPQSCEASASGDAPPPTAGGRRAATPLSASLKGKRGVAAAGPSLSTEPGRRPRVHPSTSRSVPDPKSGD